MNRSAAARAAQRPPVPALAWAGLAGVVIAGLVVAVVVLRPAEPPALPLLSQAKAALARKDYALAERLASQVDRQDRAWVQSRLLAGDAAMRDGRFAKAAEFFAAVPRDGTPASVLAARSLGEVSRETGRLSDAERAYAYVLERNPDDLDVHLRTAFLLGVTGRRWEAEPHLLRLIPGKTWDLQTLAFLGDLERPWEFVEHLRRWAAEAPDDVLVKAALAANAVTEGRAPEARERLRQVVKARPDLLALQAMLGELLADGDPAAFAEWDAALPAGADRHPDVWFARGLWARKQGEPRVAARCFWEAVRLTPAHRRASYQLGQLLVTLGEPGGREFTERASVLGELTHLLDQVLDSHGQDEALLKQVAVLSENLGRLWEAYAWAATAARTFPNAAWAPPMAERTSAQLSLSSPRTLPSANLAARFDLSKFPGPADLLRRARQGHSEESDAPVVASFRFTDDAAAAGIDFVYDNGPDPSTKGARMFETTGGGVAAFDFDADARPDLYFPQGADWPHDAPAPTESDRLTDRLYHNTGTAFRDVTTAAGLGDRRFGQGCAAGDLDNDGFADLYVANVGPNRLYRNNGDGTFADVTASSGLTGEEWTTSCAVVDLNADGTPDLYDVNYLSGEGVYRAICGGHACSPLSFAGTPDRLQLGRGDGTFESLPNAVAASRTSGKGLGIIAADLRTRGRPDLFVANDQVANLLLRNFPSKDAANLRLEEDAFVSGVAVNADGLPMASMGVAADDADGDGRLDLFVTTFKDESNMLYRQDTDGLFVDSANAAGLRAGGLPYVGWGTQFLDADRDGEPDIVCVNGHVDDYRDEGGLYQMRPQVYRNKGAGRFEELGAAAAGEFFARELLGRGLARLDWNGDGLTDFAVSNIGDRASLVTNRTAGAGRFLDVRLHATTTARDAIGTVVEVAAGGRRRTKQLVGGDGFMAANERVLQFGLGTAAAVEELVVRWPSGATQTFRNLPADARIDLVEGRPPRVLRSTPGPTPLAAR